MESIRLVDVGERIVRFWLARLLAPLLFFAAATLLVLIVRESFDDNASGRVATFEQTDAAGDTVVVTTTLTETEPAPTTTDETTDEIPVIEDECTPPKKATYRVKAGETLESIAEKVCTTSTELKNLNPDVDSVALQLGQTLRIKPKPPEEDQTG